MKDWCFNCKKYTETNVTVDSLKCSVCGLLTGLKSNDPPGHPDDWIHEDEEE